MSAVARLAIPLPLLLVTAGCLGLPGEPANSPADDWLEGRFLARYQGDGFSLSVELKDALLVLGRDGSERKATPLVLDFGIGLVATYWMDATGRVVRVDIDCPNDDPSRPCPNDDVSWTDRGILPPLGLAWPHFIQDGQILFNTHDASTLRPVEWDPEGGLLVVQDASRDVPGSLSGAGTFRYDSKPVPVSLDLRNRNEMHLERLEYRNLGPLVQRAEVWPLESWTLPDASADEVPGAGQRIGNWEHTLQEHFDALRNQSPEAAAYWDSGCLVYVSLDGPFETTLAPGLLDRKVGRTEATEFGIEGSTGLKEWYVTHTRDVAERFNVQGPEAVDDPGRSCANAKRARIDWATAFDHAVRFAPPDVNVSFAYAIPSADRWNSATSPADYSVAYLRTSFGIQGRIHVNAVDGMLDFFYMPPADLAGALEMLRKG